MRFEHLDHWLEWLETLHPCAIDLGLARVKEVYARLRLPRPGLKLVTVAGTNGKGSCVAVLEACLLHSGYRVGTYTSPHLMDYCERIKINGVSVDQRRLCETFAVVDEARGEISLTYFEFGTLAALVIFAEQPLDVVVLEVGLGGRLDAVNIVDADYAVITNIAMDHEDWLGHDVEQIAIEKSGIIRPQQVVVVGQIEPPKSLLDVISSCRARLYLLGRDYGYVVHRRSEKQNSLDWWGQLVNDYSCFYKTVPLPNLAVDSVAAALQLLLLLADNLQEPMVHKALKSVSVVGRFQCFECDGIEIILDVAHNPAAAEHLSFQLKNKSWMRPFRPLSEAKTCAVFAMLEDKDIVGVVTAMQKQITRWFVASLEPMPRAATKQQIGSILRKQLVDGRTPSFETADSSSMVVECDNVVQAYRQALLYCRPGDRVVVFGSFCTVAEILPIVVD